MRDKKSLAMSFTLGEEGGYVNHPSDPGGETNFGISRRSYQDEDIRGMTRQRAEFLLERDFWIPARCERLPLELALITFDFAVNSGVSRAAKELQKVLGVKADGVIGPVTIAEAAFAARNVPEELLWRRLGFILDNAPSYARVGLSRRVMNLRNFIYTI